MTKGLENTTAITPLLERIATALETLVAEKQPSPPSPNAWPLSGRRHRSAFSRSGKSTGSRFTCSAALTASRIS